MNQEAPESSGFYDFLAWLELNKKRIALGAAVLIVAGFVLSIVRYSKQQKELKASGEVLALRPPLNAGTNTPPVPASEFLKVAREYPSTAAAERAALLAAGALFNENKYSEAQAQFNKFLSDYPNSQWAGEAAYGVAASLEAQNQTDQALTAYQNVVNRYSSQAVASEAKQALARIYEAKKQPEMALKLYDEMTRGSGARNTDLMMKREQLLKQYPYLAKAATNSTAASPMPNVQIKPTPLPKASPAPQPAPKK